MAARSGTNHKHNLVTACENCNLGKMARYAPHPINKPKPQSRLTDDQRYVCNLLEGANFRSLWRWSDRNDFETVVSDPSEDDYYGNH